MIANLKTMGICEVTSNKLVSWCLEYEYGALGMLYTLPEYRGQGLAKAVVLGFLFKMFGGDTQLCREAAIVQAVLNDQNAEADVNICAAFTYIESSNATSQHLFNAIGFEKAADVLWAGIELS